MKTKTIETKDGKFIYEREGEAKRNKERVKNNSKLYLGLKLNCKFVTGLRIEKCKLNSGRDTSLLPTSHRTFMKFFLSFHD